MCATFGQHYGLQALSFGAVAFLIYSYGSRFLLLRYHRHGRLLADQGNFEAAINECERSYKFFSQHAWLDRYRYLTMMTPALQSFREMALVNIAYCYAQLGDKEQTEEYYRRALQEFPDSAMARIGLDAIQALNTGL